MSQKALAEFFGPRTVYFVIGKVYQTGHFANRIVDWFVQRELPVVPVSPNGGTMRAASNADRTLQIQPDLRSAIGALAGLDYENVSIVFVTPPAVTLTLLSELRELRVPLRGVWFQPGAWDSKCTEYGQTGLSLPPSRGITDCVLVNGDSNYQRSQVKL
ncbi:AaceriAER142Wp [[Ashbya] aceris (nom. inval.)]|nr:AaceriAER142Wp [[Ashbya] aceris (nom. inval.)]